MTDTDHHTLHILYDEIRHASRRLFQIFCKAAKVFQMAPDDFARNMDMPDNLIPYLHKSNALGLCFRPT